MNRLSLYLTAPPFMHVGRLGDGRPPLGAILLADLADRPATSEELRALFNQAPWCPICVLLRSSGERRRLPRSPRMCSVSSLDGSGAGSILAAVRERPRPAPIELAEWLAERVRMPGLRAPLATLLGRALSGGTRPGLGATWTDPPLAALGAWPGNAWQEVARLADLAANREAMGRLLVRRNPAGGQAVRAMEELLGASEEEFRERAGWEWVLEAAVRRSHQQTVSEPAIDVAASAIASRSGPADLSRFPATASTEWSHPSHLNDVPRHRAVSGR